MLEQIEQVLNERVRPQLAAHGGDVEVLGLENGVVRIKLLGQCSCCPSAYLTTENLIQSELTQALAQVTRVALVQQVSDSLLEQARSILSHA